MNYLEDIFDLQLIHIKVYWMLTFYNIVSKIYFNSNNSNNKVKVKQAIGKQAGTSKRSINSFPSLSRCHLQPSLWKMEHNVIGLLFLSCGLFF